jgi:polyphosphate kinase
MHRNLSSRVEAAVPIDSKNEKEKIIDVLDVLLADQRQGWDLNPDGSYSRGRITDFDRELGTHTHYMRFFRNQT